MEEPLQPQTATNDDEVLVKQKDGSFKLVKVSELNSLNVKFVKKEEKESLKALKTLKKEEAALSKPFVPAIQLYDQMAEDLIKKSGLIVPPELSQRFKIIIISRLKDVRKIPETRERLTAAPTAGGVGLQSEEAEKVLKMVEEARTLNSLNIKIVKKAEEQISPPIRGSQRGSEAVARPPLIPPDRGEILSPAPPSPSVSPKPAVPKPSVVAPSRPSSTAKIQSSEFRIRSSDDIKPTAPSMVKIVPQEQARPRVEVAPTPPPLPKPALTVAIPQTPAGRSQVADVLYKPRLVGPLEELKEMTLLDFRRLSPQAKVTTDKIYAKIELLSEQGYEKKIQGLKAWQGSPVNIIYLEILNESIGKARPIAKIIEERQKAGRETLSPEEFKMVMGLNRRLRY